MGDLEARLRQSADEVESHPHPTACDHLHVAFHVMREAADTLAASERDGERLDWLARRGIAFGASVREDDAGWYLVAPYHTGIGFVDDHHRAPTARAAIDAAMAKEKGNG